MQGNASADANKPGNENTFKGILHDAADSKARFQLHTARQKPIVAVAPNSNASVRLRFMIRSPQTQGSDEASAKKSGMESRAVVVHVSKQMTIRHMDFHALEKLQVNQDWPGGKG